MKWIDIPPIWLAAFLALAWAQARYADLGLSLSGAFTQFLAGVLIGGGVLLMALALWEFRRHQTTVIPHLTPARIIQSGIFSRTRNPIYLGDALVLAGAVLWLDAVLSLILVPVFVWVIERRFIIPEENRMRRTFRADYARYEQKVRRWV
ncbi:MAG: isoprenylcysteine carboxylmethyltransferase family protein [Pseudomonadota bacterium]